MRGQNHDSPSGKDSILKRLDEASSAQVRRVPATATDPKMLMILNMCALRDDKPAVVIDREPEQKGVDTSGARIHWPLCG
jgi:hypothetical protein